MCCYFRRRCRRITEIKIHGAVVNCVRQFVYVSSTVGRPTMVQNPVEKEN